MHDFAAAIGALDRCMDALERYEKEIRDLRAHLLFDLRSMRERLEREVRALRRRVQEADAKERGKLQNKLRRLEETARQYLRKAKHLEEKIRRTCRLCEDYADRGRKETGRYIHDLNRVLGGGSGLSLIETGQGQYVCILDSELHPQTADHIRWALREGQPATLHIDRGGAEERRSASLAGIRTRPSFDRDEYPMALFAEGGEGAHVFPVESRDNRGAGAYISWQLRNLPDGTSVRFRVI